MFDHTKGKFRENLKILDWQQKQQKLDNKIGFKDFLEVKDAFENEERNDERSMADLMKSVKLGMREGIIDQAERR